MKLKDQSDMAEGAGQKRVHRIYARRSSVECVCLNGRSQGSAD